MRRFADWQARSESPCLAVGAVYNRGSIRCPKDPVTAKTDDQTLSIFLPDFESMSVDKVLAYIERTRRQLDRFESLPGGAANPIDPEEATAIRRLCDELETSIKSKA